MRSTSANLPRLFCITDPDARIAVVIQKQPKKWWLLGRWDLINGRYEEGAWFRGTLYPQRCDVSVGGRWFSYFALKYGSQWAAGGNYVAVSRLPWLNALAAWRESGTWSRGVHFVPDADGEMPRPDVGDASPLKAICGMRFTAAAQFATERRRGWRESATSPQREETDDWDQLRSAVVMEKPSPISSSVVLSVRGMFEAFREAPDPWAPDPTAYRLNHNGEEFVLPGTQWADWTCEGNLAVATAAGQLRILDRQGRSILHEEILGDRQPRPRPARAWAAEW